MPPTHARQKRNLFRITTEQVIRPQVQPNVFPNPWDRGLVGGGAAGAPGRRGSLFRFGFGLRTRLSIVPVLYLKHVNSASVRPLSSIGSFTCSNTCWSRRRAVLRPRAKRRRFVPVSDRKYSNKYRGPQDNG